jgi:hypothetical protein
MPPKKKAKTKVGSERDQAISGAEALQLKAKLEAGEQLEDSTLLRLLKADKPCEGLYSKACKVRLKLRLPCAKWRSQRPFQGGDNQWLHN